MGRERTAEGREDVAEGGHTHERDNLSVVVRLPEIAT